MSPQPATKHDSILSELKELYTSGNYSRELLDSYEHEIRKTIQTDPASAYILLGILSVLRNDKENVHKFHINAIRLSGGDFDSLSNYATSLAFIHDFEDALHYAEKALELKKYDEPMLYLAIELCELFGYYERMDKYQDIWDELYPEDTEHLSNQLECFDSIIKNNPEQVVEPNPKMVALAEELIRDVED